MKEYFGFGGYTKTPEGYLSLYQIITVSLCMIIMITLGILLGIKNKDKDLKNKNKILIFSAILIDSIEIIKIIIFAFRSLNAMNWIHTLPLHLCSLQLITIPLAAFTKGKVKRASLDFVTLFGLLGALAGTYGNAPLFNNNPILSFDVFASLSTHSISGFASIYIIASKMYSMKDDNIKITFLIMTIAFFIALIVDYLIDENYMYLKDPKGTPYVFFYNMVSGSAFFYPVVVLALFYFYILVFYSVFYYIHVKTSDTICYDPKIDKFPYPDETDKHYLKVNKKTSFVFDEKYPYIDKSKSFRFKQFLVRILLYTVVFPFTIIRMGLIVKGRRNLRKYKKELKGGVISCSNHIHMFDYIAIMYAIRPRRSNVIVWAPNVNGDSGSLVRLVGGIPIPDESIKGTEAYMKALKDLFIGGGWLHVYSEGSMWEGYMPIRPFKRGASYFACKEEVPIVPLAFSYRKPGFIRRKIFGQFGVYTLSIGKPLFKNQSLEGKEQINDLTKRCHDEVVRLAGIKKDDNLYPAFFDHNKRVDYYTTEYGKNYRKSW